MCGADSCPGAFGGDAERVRTVAFDRSRFSSSSVMHDFVPEIICSSIESCEVVINLFGV